MNIIAGCLVCTASAWLLDETGDEDAKSLNSAGNPGGFAGGTEANVSLMIHQEGL